jgi:hypothetical protein
MSWEYRKINLNELPRRRDEIDVLCDAGGDGWELVTILPNNIAYLKREVAELAPDVETAVPDDAIEKETSEVKPKYRDPATGETWLGRGRMPNWLKKKQDAGEDIENYRT